MWLLSILIFFIGAIASFAVLPGPWIPVGMGVSFIATHLLLALTEGYSPLILYPRKHQRSLLIFGSAFCGIALIAYIFIQFALGVDLYTEHLAVW
ncbi:MAG: hypothetical protein LAT81_03375 [Oceanicaulis sp.]|nr:hypothetical protein [Oceanicaulis sp.]